MSFPETTQNTCWLLPLSSKFDSPCFPPPSDYTAGVYKKSSLLVSKYFRENPSANPDVFTKCMTSYLDKEQPKISALVNQAYQNAKKPVED